MKNYYSVTLKFGHVGKGSFTVKTVPVQAENKKEAAYRARWMGRAKHHWKDAIISVDKINKDTHDQLVIEKNNDPFFSVGCVQDQRRLCENLEEEVVRLENEIDYDARRNLRVSKISYKLKKNKDIRRDFLFAMRNPEYLSAL